MDIGPLAISLPINSSEPFPSKSSLSSFIFLIHKGPSLLIFWRLGNTVEDSDYGLKKTGFKIVLHSEVTMSSAIVNRHQDIQDPHIQDLQILVAMMFLIFQIN